MHMLQVTFKQRPDLNCWDTLSGILFQHGTLGIDEGEEQPPQGEQALVAGHEPDEFVLACQPGVLSAPLTFTAYFENSSDCEEALQSLRQHSTTVIDLAQIQEAQHNYDTESWKQYFQPFAAPEGWFIAAPWHSAQELAPFHSQPLKPLILEPGMAFGTGTHETTKTCLGLLTNVLQTSPAPSLSVLDFGCGSGILAIASKLLGASEVVALDIDPLALEATTRNAQLNGLSSTAITVASMLPTHTPPFDLIVANILKNTLLDFAPRFQQWLKPQGFLILSGLLQEQGPAIQDHFQKLGFQIIKSVPEGEWISFLLRNP